MHPVILKDFNFLKEIDLVAIITDKIEHSTPLYTDILGLETKSQGEICGPQGNMLFRAFSASRFGIVLIQDSHSSSRIARYINKYGVGVLYVSISVDNLDESIATMKESGLEFLTEIVQSPGVRQIFSKRNEDTGMIYALTESTGEKSFCREGIQKLFEEIEKKWLH